MGNYKLRWLAELEQGSYNSYGGANYMKKMMKKKKKAILILIIVIIVILIPYLFVEVNTLLFGAEFEKEYEQTNMISDVEYYKVFYDTGKKAKVYYVDGSIRAGNFVWFQKKGDEWTMEKWETVWSEQGSADGITFPFYR